MNAHMDEWHGCMDTWTYFVWVDVSICGHMDAWMNLWMCGCMHRYVVELRGGRG